MHYIYNALHVFQLMSALIMVNLNKPNNIKTVNEVIVEISTFQVFQTDSLDELIYGIREEDKQAFSVHFEHAGFEGILLLENIGTPLYFIYVVAFCLLVKLVLKKCLCGRVSAFLHRMSSSNSLIRLLTSLYFELCLLALVNLKQLTWSVH